MDIDDEGVVLLEQRLWPGNEGSLIISETIKRMKYVGTLVSSFAWVK